MATKKTTKKVATKTSNFTTWGAGTNKKLTVSAPRVGVSSPSALAKASFNPILGGGNISAGEPTYTTNKSGNLVRTIGQGATNTKQSYSSNSGGSISYRPSSATNESLIGSQTLSSSNFSSPSGQTGLGSNASSVPQSSVVNTNTLGTQNQKLTFPEANVQDYSSLIPTAIEPVVETEDKTQTALQDYLDSLQEIDAPSSADAYNKAQRELGIKQKQELVNTLTGQLNGIVAKGQASQLSLVGQGRGIPEAIIGGQQAQIGRETAIAALPVQAQLSAAQGNLEMANDNLETLFKIYSEDAKNKYNNKKEVLKLVYDVATAKEKRELEKIDKLEERTYQEKQAVLLDGKAYAKMAFANGQSTLGSQIMKLDINSPTYSQDLSNLIKGIKDPRLTLDIENAKLQNQKLTKEISLLGEPSAAEKKQIAADLKSAKSSVPAVQDKINAIDVLLEHSAMDSRVGTSFLTRTGLLGMQGIADKLSGAGQDFSGGIHKLTSGLSLDSLIDAKSRGATFGALSDREMNILSSAATKLADWEVKDKNNIGKGYWNIDESSFKKELKTIQDLSRRALLLSQGTVIADDEQSLLDSVFSPDNMAIDPSNYY